MSRIVTLTMNPVLDEFLEVPHVKPNAKLRCAKPLYLPGGGGINVSRALRRLGGSSVALYLAGGGTGKRLTELLARETIPTSVIPIADETRQNVNVLETEGGLEYRFVVPGPKTGVDEWKRVLLAIQYITPRPDYLVASGTLPLGVPVDFYARLAALSQQFGFRLIVDTSGEALRHIGRGTFLLKPNVGELMSAGSDDAVSDPALAKAARALVDTGKCEVVVVSAGAGGALLADRSGVRRIPAPVVPVRSRVGAGDSMVAAMVLALSNGSSIDEAVMFGVAAGSAAVMTRSHELCRLDDTNRLFDEVRERCGA
ncbi:MAG: 1-phosphofructokinase family hexose kinase, partial [Thermoanaerobaculia bacterium]